MKNPSSLFLAVALAGLLVAAPAGGQAEGEEPDPALAQPVAELTDDDCVKCHPGPPQAIREAGGAHRDAVSCQDCHQGHPPAVTDNIPPCSRCHSGETHFELDDCLECHHDPHTPLQVQLPEGITEACLTCHTEQQAQLQGHQSMHSALACTTCHEQHTPAPECFNCHEGHADFMVLADCFTCHRAHMPLEITYPESVASKHCGACHSEAYQLLAASRAKHNQLGCATCHRERHPMTPQCQDCHGEPHSAAILEKFPACSDCHGPAHDLRK